MRWLFRSEQNVGEGMAAYNGMQRTALRSAVDAERYPVCSQVRL